MRYYGIIFFLRGKIYFACLLLHPSRSKYIILTAYRLKPHRYSWTHQCQCIIEPLLKSSPDEWSVTCIGTRQSRGARLDSTAALLVMVPPPPWTPEVNPSWPQLRNYLFYVGKSFWIVFCRGEQMKSYVAGVLLGTFMCRGCGYSLGLFHGPDDMAP